MNAGDSHFANKGVLDYKVLSAGHSSVELEQLDSFFRCAQFSCLSQAHLEEGSI